MKIRVAKKIVKNEDNLNYNKGQVKRAKDAVASYERNKKAE